MTPQIIINHINFYSCFLLVGHGMVGGVIGNNNNNINQPLPPCTRILAMNMIGDLMRKVGVSTYFDFFTTLIVFEA